MVRQWVTLLSRQFKLKFKEKSTFAALLLPPVAIALGTRYWPRLFDVGDSSGMQSAESI